MAPLYLGFVAFILILLALDLGVLRRGHRVMSVRGALGWSAAWIGLGLAFTAFIYFGYEHHWLGLGTTPDATGYNDGRSAALKYLTGFVVEKSLAIDNIFVIATIFAMLEVPERYQHRVLIWGIVGALLMRGAMIALGAALIAEATWIVYVFGGFLLLTGLKMLRHDAPSDPERGLLVRAVRRVIPVSPQFHGAAFFVRVGGARLATPLFLALVLVELTDVLFSVDSIPAIFAVTTDAFLVFTSNVFAILGLRSLYFALAGMMARFKYLKVALALVLVVIGIKMLAHAWLEAWLGAHFNLYVLALVAGLLAVGVLASLYATRPAREPLPPV